MFLIPNATVTTSNALLSKVRFLASDRTKEMPGAVELSLFFATSSISSQKSAPTTDPCAPTSLESRNASFPVPVQTSRTFSPLFISETDTSLFRHIESIQKQKSELKKSIRGAIEENIFLTKASPGCHRVFTIRATWASQADAYHTENRDY